MLTGSQAQRAIMLYKQWVNLSILGKEILILNIQFQTENELINTEFIQIKFVEYEVK